MTLARTALRLVVSAALKGAGGARPTIAEGRFYDSRISDLAPESVVDDAKPVGILLTDGDEGEALSEQNGGSPFHRLIELVIELGMVQAIAATADEGGGYIVGYPDTDRRLEASLDLLEFQVMRRLSYDPAPLPVLFRKFVRIRKHDCHRQVTDDTGVKLACRLLTLTCEVTDDRVEIYNSSKTQPTGLDLLPEPLKSVAKALADGSSELEVCNAIAAALNPPLSAGPLEGFDAVFDNKTPTGVDDPSHKVGANIDLPQ
ncbi:hypothetical protein XI06_15085 [Bradyrhizobium sp. CCBAU 11434]|uniref:hypothetical protein n=1 Tax=Bradyrhizobium sp. CCBAU 11434 TaxID=1630885 RepID=UPI002305CC74|nr:hypothetical protein [Bradyrhizobium sp. CCBAU 11434]MDA9521632.1 hypothetical protein [Bradyrhizobium sp. CCBAU 11434]